MPGLTVTPNSIVNQITQLLRDRYHSGIPILKELLQNADDAEARRFVADFFDRLPGSTNASSPLLRAPGVLVLNDGAFSDIDMQGIRTFGDSTKAHDSSRIGKFGIGQKAVFHLCDAFVVIARGHPVDSPFQVVNPFVDIENLPGNVTSEWDGLSEADRALLLRQTEVASWKQCLGIWIPFRSQSLRPTPEAGFSSTKPDIDGTADSWSDEHSDLCTLLTMLRHVREVTIRRAGRDQIALRVVGRPARLSPAKAADADDGFRALRGTIQTDRALSGSLRFQYVGREQLRSSQHLEELRASEFWPKTQTAFASEPQPEKSKPHGAVTLWRDPQSGNSELSISWAVFLPVADDQIVTIPVPDPQIGRARLLLHGYFFLDSGRQRIEGIDGDSASTKPMDESAIRRAWNAELAKTAVLPLLPRVLHDTLAARILKPTEVQSLVTALVRSEWFRRRRDAICREQALVWVLKPPGARTRRPESQLLPATSKFRPLPDFVARRPPALAELFPNVWELAANDDLVLCTDVDGSLTATDMTWSADELATLFASLQPGLFSRPTSVRHLREFVIEIAKRGTPLPESVTHRIVAVLRDALLGSARLAGPEIADLLVQLPDVNVRMLPGEAPSRRLLSVLARSAAAVLIVPASYMPDGSQQIDKEDLTALLGALEPEVGRDGPDSEAASRTALALIQGHGSLSAIASDAEMSALRLFRAREIHTDFRADPISKTTILSINRMRHLVTRRRLFSGSPDASTALPILADALPGVSPVILDPRLAKMLREAGVPQLFPLTVDRTSLCHAIRVAADYGRPRARRRLLDHLRGMSGGQDDRHMRQSFRCLCAGSREASDDRTDLYTLTSGIDGLERVMNVLLQSDSHSFLVPPDIADALSNESRRDLGIQPIGVEYIDRVPRDRRLGEAFASCRPTEDERAVLLRNRSVVDDTLRALPIFQRVDGTIGPATRMFRETGWPVPRSLTDRVLLLHSHPTREARRREHEIIPQWSPADQVATALAASGPHKHQDEILAALAVISDTVALDKHTHDTLRTFRWLVVRSRPTAPDSILNLPNEVAEEARNLELAGLLPRYASTHDLPSDIRDHPGFRALAQAAVPNRDESIHRLAAVLAATNVVGRLGAARDYPLDAFRAFASGRADLRLPGWPLLAAVLRSDPGPALTQRFLAAFASVTEPQRQLAIEHLNALADTVGHLTDAALSAYHHALRTVANWSDGSQRMVFSTTQVPTRSGLWRSGTEVVAAAEGIHLNYLLEPRCADILNLGSDDRLARGARANPVDRRIPTTFAAGGWEYRKLPTDRYSSLDDLESAALSSQSAFLKRWIDRVPPRLLVVYLALLGRRQHLGGIVQACAASNDIETWWDETRQTLQLTEEHRLIVDVYGGHLIRAVSLAGSAVDVPPDTGSLVLLRGNGHRTGVIFHVDVDGTVIQRHVSVLRIREDDIAAGTGDVDPVRQFRALIETVFVDCLRRWREPDMRSLAHLLDDATNVNQTTLKETTAILRDRFPQTLGLLKPPAESTVWRLLNKYHEDEMRAVRLKSSTDHVYRLKDRLVQDASGALVVPELLAAARSRIAEFGYSPTAIPFELLQNADDAYVQLGERSEWPCFALRTRSGESPGFQAVHWGRPVNYLGSDPNRGHRRGFNRDLLNMLLMNFSEKQPTDGVTGRFGLGFKSVHILSDSVGIASGLLAVRTLGAVLPQSWPEGSRLVGGWRRRGLAATLIDIPYAEGSHDAGRDAVTRFRGLVTWLPFFANCVRRIEIDNVSTSLVADDEIGEGMRVATVEGETRERVLGFDLVDGYRLFLRIGRDGPCRLPNRTPGYWNLAPLDEESGGGSMLNGPFPVDPGRGRLAGTSEERVSRMASLGEAYGLRLRSAYAAVASDWDTFARALGLARDGSGYIRFWDGLFEVVGRDLTIALSAHLHRGQRGYAYLASHCQVVPTRLPDPCAGLVTASNVAVCTGAALKCREVQEAVLSWPAVQALRGSLVAHSVAEQLQQLAFGPFRDLTVAGAVARQLSALGNRAADDTDRGADQPTGRVDPRIATIIGGVVNMASVQEPPLDQERTAVLRIAAEAHFLCRDGQWHPVNEVSADLTAEEASRCAFAPDSAVLAREYEGDALEFFQVARMASGYNPQPRELHRWANVAGDLGRQRAVLAYVLRGRQGQALARELRNHRPRWLPDLEDLMTCGLITDWADDDVKTLASLLYPKEIDIPQLASSSDLPPPRPPAELVLRRIYHWWTERAAEHGSRYNERVYPESLEVFPLEDSSVRWFTLFGIAALQNLGRVTDDQNRRFVEEALDDGWWRALATEERREVAIDLLDQWSDDDQPQRMYRPWRRALVDLYTFSRWLDVYIDALGRLPRIVRDDNSFRLSHLLYPSTSPVHMRLGHDAARIDDLIGFGINWMIRELLRHEFFGEEDATVVAPYCWSARSRIRRLLDHLGSDLGNDPDMDASTRIWGFVCQHLGEERATFGGDFDLPLHLITMRKHQTTLDSFFHTSGIEPPDLERWFSERA